MDKNAITKATRKHNGKKYEFPLGCSADNVEETDSRKFVTPELKQTIEKLGKDLAGKADVLTVSRKVFVAGNGSDETGDGTEGKPYREIEKALENVPIINGNCEYEISVATGTYKGFIAKNISATITLTGDITITGRDNSSYAVEVDDSNIKFAGNGHVVNITDNSGGALLYIHNGGDLNVYKGIIKLTGSGTEGGIYIVSSAGFSQTEARISFDNLDTAIRVGTNSMFYSDALYGSVNNGIIATNGGRVAYDTNNMTATTPVITSSGGRVYTGSQE